MGGKKLFHPKQDPSVAKYAEATDEKSDHLYRFELIEGDKSRNMVIGH
jgi:hypothetical protein